MSTGEGRCEGGSLSNGPLRADAAGAGEPALLLRLDLGAMSRKWTFLQAGNNKAIQSYGRIDTKKALEPYNIKLVYM